MIGLFALFSCIQPEEPEEKDPVVLDTADGDHETLDGEWTTATSLDAARSDHVAIQTDDAVWLMAGYSGSLNASSEGVSYSLSDGTQTSLPSLTTAVAGAAAFALKGGVAVAGGITKYAYPTAVEPQEDCQWLETDGSSWGECGIMGNGPTARAASGQTAHAGYLFGGERYVDYSDCSTVTQMVQRFDEDDRLDLQTGTWETLESLPSAITDTTVVATEDALWVFGGLTSDYLDSDGVFRYE